VVRATYAAYNRGELDESRRYLSPDLEWVLPESVLHGDVLRGPDALLGVLESEFEERAEHVFTVRDGQIQRAEIARTP
jgi:ketosteroid isomerase-like protein